MKNFLVFISLVLLVSCSVQKRKYQKGFYVNRLHHKTQKENNSTASRSSNNKPAQTQAILVQTGKEPVIEAGSDNKKPGLRTNILKFNQAGEDSCDVLFFRDGSEIKAKVFEVTPTEVKYRRCDNPDGPSYVTRKADLFMVKYVNGTREVMKADEQVQKQPVPANKTYNYKKNQKVNHPLAPLSLVFGILSVIMPYIALFVSLSATTFPPILLALMLLSALLAVIVSKYTLNEIKKAPDVYKGKGMALPGFIMGIIMFGIYVFIFLLVLLIFLTI